jgi:hypothetical protein
VHRDRITDEQITGKSSRFGGMTANHLRTSDDASASVCNSDWVAPYNSRTENFLQNLVTKAASCRDTILGKPERLAHMSESTITSQDRTHIVYERHGSGPPLILEGQGHGAHWAAPELFARTVSAALAWTPST